MSNTQNATGLYNPDGSVTFYGNTGGGGETDLSDYAKQEELSNLVLTGATNTSGATISAGTCFVLNGDFVTAKADIASGATFTLNTNYEKKSVGSILTELNSNLGDISSASEVTGANAFAKIATLDTRTQKRVLFSRSTSSLVLNNIQINEAYLAYTAGGGGDYDFCWLIVGVDNGGLLILTEQLSKGTMTTVSLTISGSSAALACSNETITMGFVKIA